MKVPTDVTSTTVSASDEMLIAYPIEWVEEEVILAMDKALIGKYITAAIFVVLVLAKMFGVDTGPIPEIPVVPSF